MRLLLIICLFFSCVKKDIKTLKYIKNYTFYSGFNSGNRQIVKLNGEEFIFYADYNTFKKIVIHSFIKNEVQEVDLSKIINRGEKIFGYEVVNLDSIYVLTRYTSKVFLINNKGNIKQEIDFNQYSSIKNKYELMRSSSPFLYNDTTFIFSLDYRVDTGTVKENHNNGKKEATLFKVNNFKKDSLSCKLGLYNLYNNFTTENDFSIEGNNFTFINERIIFYSAYSDTLYIINPITLALDDKVKITSEFSQVHINPVKITDQLSGKSDLNKNFKSNGQIRGLLYDSRKNKYFCFVTHKPKKKVNPWSIIVLDEKFNKIDEVKMDHTKYSSSGVMTDEGILISNYYETLNDKDHFKKNTMTLFRYE